MALFNAGESEAEVNLVFEDVGFASCDRVTVRDLLAREERGVHIGGLSNLLRDQGGFVPAHGVAMYNLSIVW